MRTFVEIIQEAPDRMHRQVWRFSYNLHWATDRNGARLDYYAGQKRDSTRKLWRNVQLWQRIEQRGNTIKLEPIISAEMQEKVLKEFASSLRFYVDDQPRKA